MVSWRIRLANDPSIEWSTATGDIIHNLRSALDHVAITAVESNGGDSKGVYFPFAADEAGLEDQIRSKKFNRASAAAIDLLRQLKPYKGGNDRLRALHDLDISDKHKALISLAGSGTQTESLQIGGANLDNNSVAIREGGGFLTIRRSSVAGLQPIVLKVEPVLGFGLVFFLPPLIPELERYVSLVAGIVARFEELAA